MCLEAHCVLGFIVFSSGIFRASFSKDDKYPVSNNINYIRLVSICSLGTVLWLTLVLAGHLCCSLNGVTVETDLCATCHIFALLISL